MATANRDIRLKRSTLILISVPHRRSAEESLTVWFARIDLPEEFRAGIDHNDDIVDFVFGERRIEGTSARGHF